MYLKREDACMYKEKYLTVNSGEGHTAIHYTIPPPQFFYAFESFKKLFGEIIGTWGIWGKTVNK